MMKRLLAPLIALSLAAPALSGCALFGLPSSPRVAAESTVADESTALKIETIYKGWRAFVETGVDLGVIRGATAAKMQDYDNRIYAWVRVGRTAYAAGNSASYQDAVGKVRELVAEGMAASKTN